MLIKLTDKCSMGCSHCMSDCTPSGSHMTMETLEAAIGFYNKYGGPTLLLSGGEPTEHPEFKEMVSYVRKAVSKETAIVITTNGLWLTKNVEYVKSLQFDVSFQVVVDDRYYPVHVDEDNEVFTFPHVLLCRNVTNIYPQGRALQNNLPFRAKASKCFNIRAMTKQLNETTLKQIIFNMNMRGFFCSPHIDINGNIKLGESTLCPTCANIHDKEIDILNAIKSFQCHKCNFINNTLPSDYRRFVE